MSKPQAIIVDDHRLFRNGLKFILGEINLVEVIAEASNGVELINFIKKVKPDIILMDINMPEMNGVEATKKAIELYPDIKILILSMFGDDEYYNVMIDLGVKGFILKDSDPKELKTALETILDGGTYFSQDLLLKLIRKKTVDSPVDITSREKEILILICKGYSTQKVSEQLNISERTVERHRASLLEKTESSNSISLAIFAIKNNLIKLD